LCKEKRYIGTMPLRRCRERPVVNTNIEEEMRQLRARIDTMEKIQRRAPGASDVSDDEIENIEEEEVVRKEETNERLMRDVVKLGTREKMEFFMYEGNLNVKYFLDWISTLIMRILMMRRK
jgi:hypothetical protein